MVCIKCGRLADVKLPDLTEEIERNSGEKIISYDLRIRYICPECKNKTDK